MRVGRDGRVGIRLKTLDGARPRAALAYRALGDERPRAEAEEEARLFYVAMTRAREQLILSGAARCETWPEARPGAAPIDVDRAGVRAGHRAAARSRRRAARRRCA